MRGMTGRQVRRLRGKETGAVFGARVRHVVAEMLQVPVETIPSVGYTQVSRWEARGLDPSTRKLTTLVYLAAMRRIHEQNGNGSRN